MRDFMAAAMRTKTDSYHGEMVGLFFFLNALREFQKAADHLDHIKKTLFYGRKLYNVETNFKWGGVNCEGLKDIVTPDTIHAILGLAGESGELIEALIATVEATMKGDAAGLDTVNLKEEAGDKLWFLALLFKELDTDFSTEGARVIAKLKVRFPDRFTEDRANTRDLDAERVALEAGDA